MKGKGVSKENAEKAQLKAKAREPGNIFLLLCLLSFLSTFFFLPYLLTSYYHSFFSNLISCLYLLFTLSYSYIFTSFHFNSLLSFLPHIFTYVTLLSFLSSLPYSTYIAFLFRRKSKEGRGRCGIIRRIRERGEQSRARQTT